MGQDLLSVATGLGQAALTVAAISYAIVSLLAQARAKDSGFPIPPGTKFSAILLGSASLVVVALWCVVAFLSVFVVSDCISVLHLTFGCNERVLFIMEMAIGGQIFLTGLYALILLVMIYRAVSAII